MTFFWLQIVLNFSKVYSDRVRSEPEGYHGAPTLNFSNNHHHKPIRTEFCTEISAKITRKTLTSPGIDAETPTRVTLYYCPIPFTPPHNAPSTRIGVSRWLRVAIDSADTIIPKRIYGKVRYGTTSHGRRLIASLKRAQKISKN